MDVTVYPHPNPALTEVLRSARMRAIMLELAELAQALYREEVAKRTGALAASARAYTEIGGIDNDRWIGVLSVGSANPYDLHHEFGTERSEGITDGENWVHGAQAGADDLNRVLDLLGVAGAL